jgi:superfamily II DNA or RNA helicase
MGVDVYDAKLGSIVSGTRSGREFMHRLGRLLRPKVDTPDATNTSTTANVKARLIEIVSSDTHETGTSEKRKKAFTRVYQKG